MEEKPDWMKLLEEDLKDTAQGEGTSSDGRSVFEGECDLPEPGDLRKWLVEFSKGRRD